MNASFVLDPALFTPVEREIVTADGLWARAFRYPTGVAGLRLGNGRGHIAILPWMGQIVWDAVFDGVRLTMDSLFEAPHPATEIIDTYGCFAFHSGLLRNGCPGPADTHLLHGEMACAPMDSAVLTVGQDADGAFIRLSGERRYARGFGDRYVARPAVTLHAGATLFDIAMDVTNTGGRPMELMYMCHVNFAWEEGAELIQPAQFDSASVVVRTAVPAHVPSDPALLARIAALAADPSPTRRLNAAFGYDPEQVFYLRGLGHDTAGDTRLMLRRPQGDGFAIAYSTHRFPHTVRWLLHSADHRVAAFALPSTCEPEGYLAERAKGHVQTIAPGGQAAFTVRAGYLDASAADDETVAIAALTLLPGFPDQLRRFRGDAG